MWFDCNSLWYNIAAFCEIWNFKQLYAFNVRPTSGPPSVPSNEKIENLNQPYYSQCLNVGVWGFWPILGKKGLRKRFRPTSGPPSVPTRLKIGNMAPWLDGHLKDLSNEPPTKSLRPHLHTQKCRTKFCCWLKKKRRNGIENRTLLRRYTSTGRLITDMFNKGKN